MRAGEGEPAEGAEDVPSSHEEASFRADSRPLPEPRLEPAGFEGSDEPPRRRRRRGRRGGRGRGAGPRGSSEEGPAPPLRDDAEMPPPPEF